MEHQPQPGSGERARGLWIPPRLNLKRRRNIRILSSGRRRSRSIVLTVAKLSVGSVLKQGDALFTLMPVDTPLEAEARVASRDVGFVRTGDRCTLKIDAFNYMEHGTAEGTVRWISDGAFSTDDDTGQPVDPFYKVRCSIDALHFQNVGPKFRLIPGMTLTGRYEGRHAFGARLCAQRCAAGIGRVHARAVRPTVLDLLDRIRPEAVVSCRGSRCSAGASCTEEL